VRRGEHAIVNEEYLRELTILNNLVAKITATSRRLVPELKELIDLAVESFKLFARFEAVSRLYLTSIIELFAALITLPNVYKLEDLWECLQDLNVLPYQIGLRRNTKEIIAGTCLAFFNSHF